MQKKILFGMWLKALRERSGKTAAELVEGTSISRQVIYKAERAKESTRLTSLRDTYKRICKDEDEWLELVLRWTEQQDGADVDMESLREGYAALRVKTESALMETGEGFAYLTKDKTPEAMELIRRVIRHSEKKGLQQMVHSYLDAMEGIAGEN